MCWGCNHVNLEKTVSIKDVSFVSQYFVRRFIKHASNTTLLDWNQPVTFDRLQNKLTTVQTEVSSTIVNSWKPLPIVAKSSILVSCGRVPGSISISLFMVSLLFPLKLYDIFEKYLRKSILENHHNISVNLKVSNTTIAARNMTIAIFFLVIICSSHVLLVPKIV